MGAPEYYGSNQDMAGPGMRQGEPAVGVPYQYNQPPNPPYMPHGGAAYAPPAGVYHSQAQAYPSQTNAYPAPGPANVAPHGPVDYAPPHGPVGYAPPHGPVGYAPPHGPAGYAPPYGPGHTVPQPGPPGSPRGALVVYAPPSPQNPMQRNPYQAGVIPPNAIYVNPAGIPLRDTFYGDTPAPFQCPFCTACGVTTVRAERSVAAYIGCMMAACIGVCFLLPQCDCLWHKFHYCPSCGQKVGDFTKADPCTVVDPTQWTRLSFGVPA